MRQGIDNVVHLGAGRCSELDEHLAHNPKQILLVEADRELAEALAARTAEFAQTKVVCAAVAGQQGPRILYRYNLPDAGSLRPATGLHDLYPGLQLLEEVPVTPVDLGGLLQGLELDPERDNLLIVDLPGEELPALEALQVADLVHRFRELRLHCGRDSLYEDSVPAEHILQWLAEAGFDLMAEDDSQDPDRPCWTLRRNALMLRNLELQRQIDALSDERDGLTAVVAERALALEELQRLVQEQAQALRHAEAESQQATVQRTEQAEHSARQIEALKSERDTQLKIAQERLQQIERLSQDCKAEANRIVDLQQQLPALAAEREKALQRIAQLQAQQEQQLKTKAELEATSKQDREQLHSLRQKLAEHAQSQGQLKSDLAAIQAKHDEATARLTERERQLNELVQSRQEGDERMAKLEAEVALVKSQRDQAQSDLDSARQRIDELEQRVAERDYRQRLLDSEFLRAEAQFELIKDILIREKAF